MVRVRFVTRNKHKVLEASAVLARYDIEVVQAQRSKVEIQSASLEEVVRYALRSLKPESEPIVVEDAGLFIHRLNGFPGPYSSFVYKTIGIEGVLKLMEGVEDREASFASVVGILTPSGEVRLFSGVTKGGIATESRGSKGFGFDPIFIPEGCDKTFAEMSIEEKNALSHRAKAFMKLGEWLTNKS